MARIDPQVNFRMPQELRNTLETAARANNRTLTAEIVSRLESSFRLPGMIDRLVNAGASLESVTKEGDSLTQKVIELYEAQVALSSLQQCIIDTLLAERGQGKHESGSAGDASLAASSATNAKDQQQHSDSEAITDPMVLIKHLGVAAAKPRWERELGKVVEAAGKPRTPKIPGTNTPKRSSKRKP